MRILRISHSAVVDAWRERERFVRRHGHDVQSVSAVAWDEGGVETTLVARPGEPVLGVRTWGRHPALFVYDPRALWRLLGQDWDVLDLHEEPFALATAEILAIRALRRSRVPYLLYSAQNIDKRYPPPFSWLERWALRHARAVSVCNSQAGAIVTRKGLTGRAVLIGLGLDTAAFAPAASRPASRIPTRVGYVGRLAPHKGVHVLIKALALEPTLALVIAGAGPQEDELRMLADGVGAADRIEFVGSVDQAALPDFYRSLDVLAVPSLTTPTWVEQFGRVAVEAMSCGAPVVASDSGALPDVVGTAGLLAPPGEAPAWASALRRVGVEPGLSARMATEGIGRARAYDWDAIGRTYMDLYESVAGVDEAGTADRGPEILVVAYHSADLLRETLAPISHLTVTVVDNSSDADVRSVCAGLGVRYLDPGHNGGFAAGVNHGLAHRLQPQADVLLLNPDAVVHPAGIRRLHAALLDDPELASVGPAQVDGEGRASRVAWPFPSPGGAVLEAIGLGRLRRDHYVIGSVLLLRAEALSTVGGLDESFFLYAEETDWARRAANVGWRHQLVPDVTALHLGSATSSDPAKREAHFHASQERYHRKHFGRLGWQVTRAAIVVGSAVRALLLSDSRATAAWDRACRYLHGPAAVAARGGHLPPLRRSE